MIWVFDTTSMQCMKDTPFTTSKIDGLNYEKTGGPRRARVPISACDLQGSFSKIYGLELSIGSSSRAIAWLETTMESNWPVPGLSKATLYVTNTTSLKAWQWMGCSSAFEPASLSWSCPWWSSCSTGQAEAMGLIEASEWWWCGTRLCPRKAEKQIKSRPAMCLLIFIHETIGR